MTADYADHFSLTSWRQRSVKTLAYALFNLSRTMIMRPLGEVSSR
jgi:hypothetical protein